MADKKVNLWISIKDGISNAVKSIGASWNKNMQSMKASALQFTAVFAGIVAGVYQSIKAASDLQETSSKFDTVFGKNVGIASKAVDELTGSYAMSTREAKLHLSSLQDLLVPMGMNADAATKMSINTVKLAADLGSFNNLPTEQVMMDIQSALVGNFETMKKYGVVLNETRTKQEAMNMGLWDGKGTLDAATKAQVAYELIVRGSEAALGDMARTADGYANTVKRMSARTQDVIAKLGDQFLPIATQVAKAIGDAAEKMMGFIDAHKDLVVPLTAAIGIITGLSAAIGGVAVALPIIAPMFAALTGPIGIAVVAIGGITSALLYFKNSNSDVAIKVRAAWETLGGIISKYAEAISLSIKFRFGEARQAYKDLATLIADSKNVFAANVEAEKASLQKSVDANATANEAKKQQQITHAEESFAIAQEFDDIRREYEEEMKEEQLAFAQATHEERLQYLEDALGKERIAKDIARAQDLIANKQYNEARKIEEKLYSDAFIKNHADKLKKEADMNKAHRARDAAELISTKLQELFVVEATEEQKRAIADQTRSFIGNLTGLMRSENKTAFEVGKRAAQAEAIINTYLSATKAFSALASIPYVGPVLGGVAAAAAIASGLMNVRRIEQTQFQAAGGAFAPGDGATVRMGEVGNPEWIANEANMSAIIDKAVSKAGNGTTVKVYIAGSEMQPAIIEIENEKKKMQEAGIV